MTEGRQKPWHDNQETEKFYNEDYLVKIFEDGNEEEISKAAQIHQWDQDRVNSWRHYIPLRRDAINAAHQDLAQRIVFDQKATAAEISMGCYIEKIEPQVRKAVMDLRSKGYSTFSSGFDLDGQSIAFEAEDLKGYELPQNLVQEFLEKGVDLSLVGNKICMTFYNFFTLEQIVQFWEEISATLPALNREAPTCLTNAAKEFRQTHKNH